MELTIEQALQQGVAAHKEGKLQEAERLYRAILQSQPTHPDANHNLGVIALSVNRADMALQLFQTALEANPNVEQYWHSYVATLVKTDQFEAAEKAVKTAADKGYNTKNLEPLLHQFKVHTATQGPSKAQIGTVLEHYQNGAYLDAEELALLLTREFPQHPFGFKALGVVLRKLGRIQESIFAGEKSVQLAPEDPEAHNNLGNTLRGLGRLEEAEASYNRAITLKSNYAEAHDNLGTTLKQLERLDEALASYKQAIAFKPDFAEAHNNLGVTLQELGRLDQAEASYSQAISLKPDCAESHNNLGNTLQKLGRIDEAVGSYKQAITLNPNYAKAYSNLANILEEVGRFEEAEASYKQAIMLKPDYAEAHSKLGNMLRALGRIDEAEASYTRAIELNPENFKAHNQLLRCLYLQDKKSAFFDELDYLIDHGKANAIIGSLTCRSAMKYGLEKKNLFCKEPMNYVSHFDLKTQCDFKKIFVEKLRSILNESEISNRRQALLVNGTQTSGNIFDIKSDTNEIQSVIRSEIEKYRIKFKKSNEGLIKRMPAEYDLRGWLICMRNGGNLKPHIHSEGWLSGSIYINVPRKIQADSGNLVVSLGEDEDAIDKGANLTKTINVTTGSMVIFPASLTHYTIPFESKEERIVLAFDVKED